MAEGAVIRCWRLSLAARLGVAVAVLATAPIALISTARQVDHPISDPLTAIVMYAAIWWFGLVRPAVWLSPDELVVRNPLRTYRIAREDVVSARSGLFGAVISRRAGRPRTAVALHKTAIAVGDPSVGLINYWAQAPRSGDRDEGIEALYPEKPHRSRAGEIVAAAGLAVAFTLPAVLLAWPRHPGWFGPAIGLTLIIALVPVVLTQPRRRAPHR